MNTITQTIIFLLMGALLVTAIYRLASEAGTSFKAKNHMAVAGWSVFVFGISTRMMYLALGYGVADPSMVLPALGLLLIFLFDTRLGQSNLTPGSRLVAFFNQVRGHEPRGH